MSTKKQLKIDQDLYEELTCEEILARYEPFLKKKAIDFSIYAKSKFYKHVYAFDEEDMKQIALMGAIKAYERYDEEKSHGVIFYTYLFQMVIGELRRYIRDIPLKRRKGISAYDFKDVNLDGEMNNSNYYSGDSDIHISDIIADPHDDIGDLVDSEFVKDLLSQLDDKQAMIVKLQFFEGKTQMQIASMFNLSQVQISRIIKKAKIKMREHIEKIKRKEEYSMPKLKPSQTEVIAYLTENADRNISLSNGIQKYAKVLDLSVTTIVKIVKASGEENTLRALYKDTTKSRSTSAEVSEIVEPKEVEADKTPYASTYDAEAEIAELLGIDKEDIQSVSIEEIKADAVSPLDGVTVDRLVVTLPDGTNLDFMGKEVKINNTPTWLTREQLVDFDKNVNKALEIYDFLYK